jgi:hypothetical protein
VEKERVLKSTLKGNIALLTAITVLLSCGKISPSDKRKSNKDVSAAEEQGGEEVVLDIVAEYESKPVDVIFLRGSSSVFGDVNVPFRGRLVTAINKEVALRELAVRLQNLGVDLQFGVLPTVFGDRNQANLNGGLLLGLPNNPADPKFIMKPGESFIEAASARMSQGIEVNARIYPMTSIKELIAKSKVDGPSKGMIRSNAILAIFALNYADEDDESLDWTYIRDLLDSEKGPGNWSLSVISPPKTGCAYKATNGMLDRHTNMHYIGLTNGQPSADGAQLWPTYVRRNKTISLQEYSSGVFQDLCADSYAGFVNSFASETMQAGFFEVALKVPADHTSIEVTVNDSPVEGWRYFPEGPKLLIPTSVKNGTKVVIKYQTPRVVNGEVVYGPKDAKESNGKIGGANVSTAQLAFANGGAQAALAGCGGNCHNGRNFANFDMALQFGANIQSRVKIADGTPGDMPPGPGNALNATQIKAIDDWVNEFVLGN